MPTVGLGGQNYKHSPGGCMCCCGQVTLPATLHFAVGTYTCPLVNGLGAQPTGTWQGGFNATPGSELLSCIPSFARAAYVEVVIMFHLLATPNALGQCFTLKMGCGFVIDAATCSHQEFVTFNPGIGFGGGCGGYAAGGLMPILNVTGVLNSFTWSPFVSSWTFASTWDGSQVVGTTTSFGSCAAPFTPVTLVPQASGAATLTH